MGLNFRGYDPSQQGIMVAGIIRTAGTLGRDFEVMADAS